MRSDVWVQLFIAIIARGDKDISEAEDLADVAFRRYEIRAGELDADRHEITRLTEHLKAQSRAAAEGARILADVREYLDPARTQSERLKEDIETELKRHLVFVAEQPTICPTGYAPDDPRIEPAAWMKR